MNPNLLQIQITGYEALAPSIILAFTALVLFVIDSISPESENSQLLSGLTVFGSLVTLVVTGTFLLIGVGGANASALSLFEGQLVVDEMSLFFTFIIASVTALVSLASYEYLRDRPYQAEYYILVLLSATGMTLMASSNSLATAFVSLELTSLPSYALVAYIKDNRGSVEAGLKYFLIGALSSAVFVYGVSLIYAVTGSLLLPDIASTLQGGFDESLIGVLGFGVVMILGGLAFKMASVPFHFWAPEAYEGAPAPISGFLSSASKAAGFVLAFRVFITAFPTSGIAGVDWVFAFQILALVTMTLGNFAAATQENVKRMLAYSSIGHAGYVLIALAALTGPADQGLVLGAGMIHLLVYGFMNTGAFLFVALAEYWGIGRTFEDYNGLANKAPVACAAMTVFLFNLAGLPIGGGFLSKYFLLFATVSAQTFVLAAALIINSALSLYFYTRVVKAMWIEDPTDDFTIDGYPSGLYAAVIAAAVVTVLLLPALFLFSDPAFEAASALF
ncbi:NADH-quinone oxidoreductase subunit N [Halocatena marina]|uniref:NADH-quinone oxidoreductase subunit N n=1 Tax=Halocatena marina TaxID=2934937 RepID=UPI00200EE2A5|nr:NADH-quinone oxidoreductase subunit N [Halocatena marina]